MVRCPECATEIDVDEDEVEEGEILACPECETEMEVVQIHPVKVNAISEDDDEEEEEEPEEPFSRPGSGKVGIPDPEGVGSSDRDELRPARTCCANSALVGGRGLCGNGAGPDKVGISDCGDWESGEW